MGIKCNNKWAPRNFAIVQYNVILTTSNTIHSIKWFKQRKSLTNYLRQDLFVWIAYIHKYYCVDPILYDRRCCICSNITKAENTISFAEDSPTFHTYL